MQNMTLTYTMLFCTRPFTAS